MGAMTRSALVLLSFLLSANLGSAAVCRSTKYEQLILDTKIVRNAEAFLDDVREQYPVSVNNSFRSSETQRQLYQAWLARGMKGNPVAKAGTSRHESGFAFDLNNPQKLTFNQWDNVLNLGERYGFEYLLGDFPGEGSQKFDWPHFQADPLEYAMNLKEAIDNNQTNLESIRNCLWKRDLTDDEKRYLEQIVVNKPRFSTVSWRDEQLTYVDAEVSNKGKRTVTSVELRAELLDSLGGVLLTRLVHPSLPEMKLQAGASISLHLLFGRVYDFWKDGPLRVRPTYVEF